MFIFLMASANVVWAQGQTTNNATAGQQQNMLQEQNVYSINPGSDPGGGGNRIFPYGMAPNYPGIANYWGTITADGRFQPVGEIIQFQNCWSREEAIGLAQQKGGKVDCQLPVGYVDDYQPTNSLTFILSMPSSSEQRAEFLSHYRFIEPATFLGKDRVITSKVFGQAVLCGLNSGADLILLLHEGFGLRMDAQSWAIGLNPQLSVVNGGSGTGFGGIASGGFGWVHAWAEYYTKPWLRVAFFRKIKDSYVPPKTIPSTKKENGQIYRPNVAIPPEMQTGAAGH